MHAALTAGGDVSHAPSRDVRALVNAENARLTQACGDSCTEAQLLAIDQQMVKLEAAATYIDSLQNGRLIPEQSLRLGDTVAALLPLYGTPIALYQALTGETIFGGESRSVKLRQLSFEKPSRTGESRNGLFIPIPREALRSGS